MPQIKVLLVDDEVEFASALAERLRLRDFDTQAVSNAEDAVTAIRNNPPDIVLLDYRMPGTDGIGLLKIIKEINPAIEVIMLTGLQDTLSMEEGMKSGIFEYMIKPVDIGELMVKINLAQKKRQG
ncbi:MAG TPA: response regulator [Thermodesulfovibrionales bacterium]|nr:response regulator [Thermodesulfovibrionales bacterium]